MQIQYGDMLPIAALLIIFSIATLTYWIFKRRDLAKRQSFQALMDAWFQDHQQGKTKVIAYSEPNQTHGYRLSYSPTANVYRAGCRLFTPKQALKHWTKVSKLKPDNPDLISRINRAKLFTQAIKQHQLSLKETSPC